MSNFEFRQDPLNRDWVIIAPLRSKRPDVAKGSEPVCPFCEGNEALTPREVYRLGKGRVNKPGWEIRVTPNKFPFAPIHEVVIHSPRHEENFFTFSKSKLIKIFKVYRQRYLEHQSKGQVFIFHNFGKEGAESLPHSHTQIAVIPSELTLRIPLMGIQENTFRATKYFNLFCPEASHWPAEVWIGPKARGESFGSISPSQTEDLAKAVALVLKKLEKFLRPEFPFNFYIYPAGDWYLRIIPRLKVLGGFEIGTNVFVNTADPVSTAKALGR
ncbi:MAG: hypothetical protein Q8P13_00810 [bacterium]|nr:hypothetical protein [bacterium]